MGSKATLNPETGLYVLEMWGKVPPTTDDFIKAGATIVPYTRKQSSYIGECYNGQVTAYVPSLDNTRYDNPIQVQPKINARLVDAEWASVLYVVRITYGNERIRVCNILKHRDTNGLYAFNIWGEYVRKIKTRKHVKPKFIQSELGLDVELNDIFVDCIQLDAIRNATTEQRNKTHNLVDAPVMRKVNYRYMYKVSSQESIDCIEVLDSEVKNPDFEGERSYGYRHDDNIPIRTKEDRDKEYRDRLDSADISKPVEKPKPIVTTIRPIKRNSNDYSKTFSEMRRSR